MGNPTLAYNTAAQWVVGRDGEVAILHVNPYSVDWVQATKTKVRGRPIPYKLIRPDSADQRQWREEFSRERPWLVMDPGGVVSPAIMGLTPVEPVRWPRHLPPFLNDAGRIAPDGNLWIQRLVRPGSDALFDVVDRRGRVVLQVIAPPNARLVGFGKTHLYLVRLDLAKRENLERYALPKQTGT